MSSLAIEAFGTALYIKFCPQIKTVCRKSLPSNYPPEQLVSLGACGAHGSGAQGTLGAGGYWAFADGHGLTFWNRKI